MSGEIALAVFDVDGVILDSHFGVVDALNEGFLNFRGQVIGYDWYQKNTLGSHRDFLLNQGVLEEDLGAFDGYIHELFAQAWRYKERPGIRSILSLLQQYGVLIHLASACSVEVTEAKISYHAGLRDFFAEIHGGEKKSAVFTELAERFQIPLDQIAFITDMERDLDEAVLAGLTKVVAITSGFSTHSQLSRYNFPVVTHPEELIGAMRAWV
ncbi:MAG: hypothetical protein A2571_02810 [Candidatus Vogelbacteria bacterium RIFOXYD1_FULL_44_32]|uniref:FCP1 homology domain-containing protein n=1 Tax=Candidatus Vogelbacteria bacterium RIFOXYD1_FULL_44_32 TaxID=1802438 RepID=A0A1G2QDK6_9BACT|nr:MAG: hypothetical protein A2571_02810 [Candidatus Vogelbacteria bacterium RIFOXYD1_FULL_44_32]